MSNIIIGTACLFAGFAIGLLTAALCRVAGQEDHHD